jgi:arylsulfatase A-like enzyme
VFELNSEAGHALDAAHSSLGVDELQAKYRHAAASVAKLDHDLGILLEKLRSQFERDDFAFFVTADRGIDLGERSICPAPEIQLSSAVVHIPLLVRCLVSDQPARRSGLSQSVDIAPTILDWFRVTYESLDFDGRSLMPTLLGNETVIRDFAYHKVAGCSQNPMMPGIISTSPAKYPRWRMNCRRLFTTTLIRRGEWLNFEKCS